MPREIITVPICLFCLRDDVLLTDEHLFPAALGGNIVVEGSVCADCNHGFSKFEQPLACELAPLRLLLKIPDRYGRVPEVAATARTKDREYEARIKNDGNVQLKPIVTVVRDNGVLRENCLSVRYGATEGDFTARSRGKRFSVLRRGARGRAAS